MKCPECEREVNALKALVHALTEENNVLKALNAVLELELKDERHRHDRYVDFELAQAKELAALKQRTKEETA